jgi:predicted rRNA methylase YqxC with S4 and FtsJ domains
MESLLVEIAKQTPALLVLVFLVLQFLKAQKDQSQRFGEVLGEIERRHEKVINEISSEADEIHRQSIEVHKQSIQVIGENSEVLRTVRERLDRTQPIPTL